LRLDALREALPVEVANHLLELSLVKLVAVLHRRHVRLNEVVLDHVAGQNEAQAGHVLNIVEEMLELVDHVELLDLEARLLFDAAALSHRLVKGLEKAHDCTREVLLLQADLTGIK